MNIFKKRYRLFIIGVLLITAGVISGCSRFELGYRYADWIIIYQLDSYFDLNGDQKDKAEDLVDDLVSWHKQNELPDYVHYASTVRNHIDAGLTRKDVSDLYDRYLGLRLRLYNKLIRKAGTFLAMVNAEQLSHLQDRMEEDNQKIEKQVVLPLPERMKIREEQMVEQFEEWIGDLTDRQEKMIEEFNRTLPVWSKDRLAFRKAKQKEFLTEVEKARFDSGKIEYFLNETMVRDWELERTPYHRKMRHSGELLRGFLLTMYQTLTSGQKDYLLSRLDDIITEFREIVSEDKARMEKAG